MVEQPVMELTVTPPEKQIREITSVEETVENPNEFVFPKLTFTEDVYRQTIDLLRGTEGTEDPIPKFVSYITEELSTEYPDDPNFISEKSLKDGTATIFNYIANFRNKKPENRKLTNEQIVELFVQDDQGRPATKGSYVRGFARKAPAGAASAAAFFKGAQATNLALSALPPVVPNPALSALFTGTRILGPIVGGTAAAMATMSGGDYVTEKAFGPRRLIVPGQDFREVAGEVFGENIFFGAIPFFLKEKASRLGTDLIVDNLKGSRSSKVTKGLENLLDRARIEAQTKTNRFATSEFGATALGAMAVGAMDEREREKIIPRLVVETTGTVTGGLITDLIAKRALDAVEASVLAFKTFRTKGEKSLISRAGRKNEELIGEFLRDYIEASPGETVETVLANLDDTTLETLTAKIKQADPSSLIETPTLTAGTKSRSAALLRLEKSLEVSGSGLKGERITANSQAIEIVKKGILLLHAMNDPKALEEASTLIKDVFELELTLKVNQSQKTMEAAFEKLQQGDAGPERIADLGKRLFKVIENNLSTDRAKETYLWKDVKGDETITEFVNLKGETTNVPNFVSVWEEILRSTPEANTKNVSKLKQLLKFTDRKKKELNLSGGSVGGSKATLKFREVLSDILKEPELTKGVGETSVDKFNETLRLEVLRTINNVRLPDASIDDTINNLSSEQLTILIKSLSNYQIEAMSPDKRMPESVRKKTAQFSKLINFKRRELIDKKNNFETIDSDASNLKPVTAIELIDMRSEALSLGKTLQSIGDQSGSNAAFAFASALLRDLESFPEGTNLQYDIARGFSKALNDTYTRAFGGEILETTGKGRLRIEPELLGSQLFQANKAFLRVKQLDNMGKFGLEQDLTSLLSSNKERGQALLLEAKKAAFDEQYGVFDIPKLERWIQSNKEELSTMPAILTRFDEASKRVVPYESEGGLYTSLKNTVDATKDLRNTTESILRKIESETFKADGTANIDTIKKWMKKETNKDLLKIFPDIKADLEDLIAGDNSKLIMFERAKAAKSERIAEKKKFASFYDLLPDSKFSPTSALIKAMTNKDNPVRELTGLWEAIQKAPDSWSNPKTGDTFTKSDAVEGFRASVLDALITSASSNGAVDGPVLYRNMFAGLGGSQNNISLAKFLENKEVFSESHLKAIESLMARLMDLDTAIASGRIGDAEGIMSKVGIGTETLISVLGSASGSRLYSMFGGKGPGTIIATGKGASAAREGYKKLFENIPNSLKSDYLKKVLGDPEQASLLIRKAKSKREDDRIIKRMFNYAVDNFFIPPLKRTFQAVATTPIEELIPDETSLNEGQDEIKKPFMFSLENQFLSDASPSMNAVRGGPQPVAQATLPAPPPAQADPQTRQKYAALFPNDPTSAMIKGSQGGIGSLFG